jgi:hypothetical protein
LVHQAFVELSAANCSDCSIGHSRWILPAELHQQVHLALMPRLVVQAVNDSPGQGIATRIGDAAKCGILSCL